MRTSPVGKPSNARARPGFTLIELLVVMSVMAVLATGAGLVAGGAFGLRDPVDRLAGRLDMAVTRAREVALYQRMVTGLQPLGDGWQMVRLHPARGWQPDGAPVRQVGALLGWTLDQTPLTPAPAAAAGPPPIRFAPDGAASPFSASLLLAGQRRDCRLGPGDEALACR